MEIEKIFFSDSLYFNLFNSYDFNKFCKLGLWFSIKTEHFLSSTTLSQKIHVNPVKTIFKFFLLLFLFGFLCLAKLFLEKRDSYVLNRWSLQSESTSYSCPNVKELLAQNRRDIWSLSDSNGIRTHNHLARKRTLNHLASLAKFTYKKSSEKLALLTLRYARVRVRIRG